MEFKIKIISEDEDFALLQSQSLRRWIEDDEELESVKVEQGRKELQAGEAGGGLLAFIQVVIGAALEPIAKTIQVWMEEKTKRSTNEFSIELEDPAGKKFKINSKNIGANGKDFVSEIINRFEGNKDYDYKITQS